MNQRYHLADRDALIDSQPILWARAMLDEAGAVRTVDARDAILARVGLTLFSRFAVTGDGDSMRTACAFPDVTVDERRA